MVTTTENTLFGFMRAVIEWLEMAGKRRSADAYRAALSSYRQFRQGRDIKLGDITGDEMVRYQAHMANRGICPNTTSFYMRILRATYNRAVDGGIVAQRHPFSHVYTGIARTVKRAIPVADIVRLRCLDLGDKPHLALARDIFLFSFYMRGMAFVDMAHLRKRDYANGIITYRRRKTGHPLSIKVEDCARRIIDRYADPASPYLLPLIKNPGDAYRQYRNALHRTNVALHRLGALTGIHISLTTYVGRHSWSSAANASNIPLSIISESLGHNSQSTTQIYLASLDAALLDAANAQILRQLEPPPET